VKGSPIVSNEVTENEFIPALKHMRDLPHDSVLMTAWRFTGPEAAIIERLKQELGANWSIGSGTTAHGDPHNPTMRKAWAASRPGLALEVVFYVIPAGANLYRIELRQTNP
jgi:hypothetical protein